MTGTLKHSPVNALKAVLTLVLFLAVGLSLVIVNVRESERDNRFVIRPNHSVYFGWPLTSLGQRSVRNRISVRLTDFDFSGNKQLVATPSIARFIVRPKGWLLAGEPFTAWKTVPFLVNLAVSMTILWSSAIMLFRWATGRSQITLMSVFIWVTIVSAVLALMQPAESAEVRFWTLSGAVDLDLIDVICLTCIAAGCTCGLNWLISVIRDAWTRFRPALQTRQVSKIALPCVAMFFVVAPCALAELPAGSRGRLPSGINPIMALAVSPDDQLAAVSRGEQLFVYDLRGPRLAARLDDPALAESHAGAAHVDLIRSLAFDRSGDWLASGGYRTVKLWRRPRTVLLPLVTSQQPIRTLAVSRDGAWLAMGTESGAIELLANKTQGAGNAAARSAILAGHTAAVTGLAFSADGATLYSASLDKSLRGWKTSDGAAAGKLATPAEVRCLVMLPGDQQLATGELDQVIRLWNCADVTAPADGAVPVTPLRELKHLNKPPTSLAVSRSLPDRLLSGDEEGRLRLWNTVTSEVVRDFYDSIPINAVAISPDGTRLAAVGATGIARLWDPTSGEQVAEVKLEEPASRAIALADSAAKYALACVEYRKEELREAEEQLKRERDVLDGAGKAKEAADKAVTEKVEVVAKAIEERNAAEAKSTAAAAAFKQAGDKRNAAQAALEQAVVALRKANAAADEARSAADKDKDNKDLQTAREAAEQGATEAKTAMQAAETALASATQTFREAQQQNQAAEQAKYEPTQKAKNLERELQEAKNVAQGAVNFISTATAVLQKAQDATPIVQQSVTTAEAAATQREAERKALVDAAQNPRRPLMAAAFSPDGRCLIVAGENGGVALLDAERGAAVEFLDQGGAAVQAIACSQDGRLWVARGDRQVVSGQLAGDWTLSRTIGRPDDTTVLADRVLSLVFHPSGKWLATGGGRASETGELKLWSLEDGSLVREFVGAHADTIHGVRFSPDGEFLATAAADRLIKIFRLADGALVHTLAGHTHHVLGLAWQPDGRRLVSCGGDNVVKLWDIESETALRTMRGDTYLVGEYKREVNGVAFIGGTEHLLTSCGDRTLRMHRTSSLRDIRCFKEGRSYMHAAAATSDGKIVLGGGRDGELHLWNGESGYPLLSFAANDPATPNKPQ